MYLLFFFRQSEPQIISLKYGYIKLGGNYVDDDRQKITEEL